MSVQANKSSSKEHQVPNSLAEDHYLLLIDKEVWKKGRKISKPHTKLVSKNDFKAFAEDRFFEKHEISVEILHDPTLGKGGATIAPPPKKEDYMKQVAELMEIDIKDVDPKLSIKELKEIIAEEKKGKR